MKIIERFQSVIIFISIVLGLLFSNFFVLNELSSFITPLLFLMLFGVFLSVPIKDFKNSFSNSKFLKVSLLMNFVLTPILAYFLGTLFLYNHVEIWIGFMMLMITPCTDWYIIFTEIAKGNVSLSGSILPINLILQIILLPIYLWLFFGINGSFDALLLIESILFIIVLPFVLAQLTKIIFKNSKNILNNLTEFFSSTEIIFLSLAIFCMFASQGQYLLNNLWILVILLIPILLFFLINFIIGRFISKIFNFNYEDSVSLSLTTLARNSPIALAIAVNAFSNEPIIALSLVIGPLIELPILAIVSEVLLHMRNKNKKIVNIKYNS